MSSDSRENHKKDSKKYESNNPFQIALRTYLLSLSLSLGPSILPLLISQASTLRRQHALPPATFLRSLNRILKRELALDGFAFSLTVAVAGGALLKKYCGARTIWKGLLNALCNDVDGSDPHSIIDNPRCITTSRLAKIRAWLTQRVNITVQKETFLSYVVSSSICISLLQVGIRRNRTMYPRPIRPLSKKQSPLLDLTLLLLVRAIDSLVQSFIIERSSYSFPLPVSLIDKADKGREKATVNEMPRNDQSLVEVERSKWEKETKQQLSSRVDAIVFWTCSARYIFICFLKFPITDYVQKDNVVFLLRTSKVSIL